MVGTSDAWLMSHSSQQPSELVYYIVDCWLFYDVNQQGVKLIWEVKFRPFLITHLKVDESIKGLLLINLLPVVIFLQLL